MYVIGAEMMTGVMVRSSFSYLKFPLISQHCRFPRSVFCYGAVVLFRSREHENCGPQPGYVRAHVES